jgi:hypothetical protein
LEGVPDQAKGFAVRPFPGCATALVALPGETERRDLAEERYDGKGDDGYRRKLV